MLVARPLENITALSPCQNLSKVCAKVNDVEIQQVPLTPDYDVVVSEVSPDL